MREANPLVCCPHCFGQPRVQCEVCDDTGFVPRSLAVEYAMTDTETLALEAVRGSGWWDAWIAEMKAAHHEL